MEQKEKEDEKKDSRKAETQRQNLSSLLRWFSVFLSPTVSSWITEELPGVKLSQQGFSKAFTQYSHFHKKKPEVLRASNTFSEPFQLSSI